jgi:hypothetical protein
MNADRGIGKSKKWMTALLVGLASSAAVGAQEVLDEALYPFFEDGAWGVITENGEIVAPAEYDAVRGLGYRVQGCRELRSRFYEIGVEGPVGVGFRDGWVFVGPDGVIPVGPYREIQPFREGLAAVNQDGRWGYIDRLGATIIPFEFDYAFAFVGGAAPVMVEGWWGLIDRQGAYLIDPIYDHMRPAGAGPYIQFETGGRIGLIDAGGEIIVPPAFDDIYPISEGLVGISLDGLSGYYDVAAGEIAIDPVYDMAAPFSGGVAEVWRNGEVGLINREGEITVAFEEMDQSPFPDYEPFQYGFPQTVHLRRYRLGRWADEQIWGLIDPRDGTIIMEPTLDWIGPLSEGRAVFQDGERFGYLDDQGGIAIPARYTHADEFANGLAAVRDEGGTGYIDPNGAFVLRLDDPSLTGGRFLPDLALVYGDGIDRYINRTGRVVFEFQSGCR